MVSDKLLHFAAAQYNFDTHTLHFISDSTNQIYMFQKNGKGYVLRFAQRPDECISRTKAEMDWLYYLAGNKISVSLPLKNHGGELAVSAEDGDKHYIITAFEMAKGQFWDKNAPERWNETVFFRWGKTMGDIHRLTKEYMPQNPANTRSAFTGRDALADSIEACPSVNAIAEALTAEIMALPKDKDSYGLIHCDMHPWNFYIEDGEINVFDFDDSLYGYFALDIGVALYHGLWWGRKNDTGTDFTESILINFIDGYLSANHLSAFWISKIPLFMKYRQICKFSWFFNSDSADAHQKERIKNIENDILFTDCKIDPAIWGTLGAKLAPEPPVRM